MKEFFGDTGNLIWFSLMLGIFITVFIYIFIKRTFMTNHYGEGNVGNKPNKSEEKLFIDQYIIFLLQRYADCDIKFLRNKKTSTNLNAQQTFFDLDALLYFSNDIYNYLMDNKENGHSSTSKSGYYRAELHNSEVIIKMQNLPRMKMTLNQLAHLNSAENLNGIVNNNLILGHDTFLYLTHREFDERLAQYEV